MATECSIIGCPSLGIRQHIPVALSTLQGSFGGPGIVRYVAIDLLFTTSPVYEPALSPPKLPVSIQLEISMY